MEVGFIGTLIAFVLVFGFLDFIVKIFYKNKKRPSEIVTIAILIATGFLINIYKIITKSNLDTGLLILSVVNLIWLYGYWNMKKWGAIGYIITVTFVQILSFIHHQFTSISLIAFISPLIVLYFYPKMK